MMSQTRKISSFSKTDSMKTKPSTINPKGAATTSSELNKNHDPRALSARTFKNSKATWSMNPLTDALPGSPPRGRSSGSSPLSSSATFCTRKADCFYSDLPTTELSTPRTQGTVSGFEVKERMENSKDFGRFCHPNVQNKNSKGSCLSKLSMCESIFSDRHHQFDHGPESPSEREDSLVFNEEYKHVVQSADQSSYEESDADETPNAEEDKQPMDRPKPYHEFLDEFKQQELKAEIEAWAKAEHMRLVTKLREEEAAIDDWEFKQTTKALKEIKKIESKLEKQRAKAVENTWKNMRIAKEEAQKKKMKVRRSTIGKIYAVSETYPKATFSTKKLLWHRVTAYCKSMYLKSVQCTALTSEPGRS